MTLATIPEFLDRVRQYHLLEPTQLAELSRSLPAGVTDARSLARELLKRNWLTPYQANQLFQGRGHELLLGSYVLLERIGEGGMGQVFKARNWKIGRVVAVKLIRKERLASPIAVQRFHREIRAAAHLHHPNIVMALDADSVGDTHFFVMEYVQGIDLSKVLAQRGPLPVAEACDYARQAALGLQHAHEKGLIHRDIKPHNLLLTQGGVVKVLDMGLARVCSDNDAQLTSLLTQEGAVMGTPDYIAPEQAISAHVADIRADLYSLGCTLYQMLTGRVPFPTGSMTEKLLRHQLHEPAPVESIRPEIAPQVVGVVRKLMAKHPKGRYSTPGEAAAALAAAIEASPAPPAPASPVPQAAPVEVTPSPPQPATSTFAAHTTDPEVATEPPPPPPRPQRRPVPALAIFGVAASLILVGSLLLWWSPWASRRGNTRPDPRTGIQSARPEAGTRSAEQKRREDAEDALKPLAAAIGKPETDWAQLRLDLHDFLRKHSGTLAASKACDLLAQVLPRVPSPLDQLDPANLPQDARDYWKGSGMTAPAGLVGVVGEHRQRHWSTVALLGFTPEGKTLVNVSYDQTCRQMTVSSGKQTVVRLQHTVPLALLALSPDCKYLAAREGSTGPVCIFTLSSGRKRSTLLEAAGKAWTFAFTPDSLGLVGVAYGESGQVEQGRYENGSTSICVWDTATGKRQKTLTLPIGWPSYHPLAVTKDGKKVAIGRTRSRDENNGTRHEDQVVLVDLETGHEEVLLQDVNTGLPSGGKLAFSSDGTRLACIHWGSNSVVWDLVAGKELFSVPGAPQLVFSPDGKFIATSNGRLLDGFSGREEQRLPCTGMPAVSPDNKGIAIASGNQVQLWDAEQGTEVRPLAEPVQLAAADPLSTSVALVRGTSLVLHDLATQQQRVLLQGNETDGATAAAYSGDGRVLATLDRQSMLRLWNTQMGAEQASLKLRTEVFLGLAPDGKALALRTDKSTVTIGEIGAKKTPVVLYGPEGASVYVTTFSPDGRALAVAYSQSNPDGPRVFDLSTGKPRFDPTPGTQLYQVRFSPDGRILAGSGSDQAIHLWDAHTGKSISKLPGLPAVATSLAFAPQGGLLASVGKDGLIVLWDTTSGKRQREWQFPGRVDALAFAHDGRHLLTSNANGTVYVLRLQK